MARVTDCDCQCIPPGWHACKCGSRLNYPLTLTGTISGPSACLLVGTWDFVWNDSANNSHCRNTGGFYSHTWFDPAVIGYNGTDGCPITTTIVIPCGFGSCTTYNEIADDAPYSCIHGNQCCFTTSCQCNNATSTLTSKVCDPLVVTFASLATQHVTGCAACGDYPLTDRDSSGLSLVLTE